MVFRTLIFLCCVEFTVFGLIPVLVLTNRSSNRSVKPGETPRLASRPFKTSVSGTYLGHMMDEGCACSPWSDRSMTARKLQSSNTKIIPLVLFSRGALPESHGGTFTSSIKEN